MSGLHLRAISHSFGDHQVLAGVSVFVAPGELVCLLGPSGCGKTTLLRIAAGLETLQHGEVEIGGELVAGRDRHLPPEKRGVGLMFQDFALFPHLTVKGNIAFGLDGSTGLASDWVERGLDAMGVNTYADAYPHTLSGGQQQRVALLRALAPEPNVLLLDEPFSGLDVSRRAQVRTDTLKLIKETGIATLMVTHDPEEAMFMADRILVMNEGRVVQDGSPTDLYFNPADAFVTELFGPVNRFEAQVAGGRAETPVGPIMTNGAADGTPVEVLIRPEGLLLDETGGGDAELDVLTARPLGRSSVVILELSDGETLEARVPGVFLPDAGSRVSVKIDPERSHAFPIEPTR